MKRITSAAHLASLLVIVVGCSSATPPVSSVGDPSDAGAADSSAPDASVPAVDPIGFRAAGQLLQARALPSATRLPDGRVLIVGGERTDYAMLASVEIYDPKTDTVTAAAPLPEPRDHHTATLLPTGEVLVTGGGQGSEIGLPSGEGILATALLYNPAKDAWRATGSMKGPRAGHRAALLADGRVLVVGGGDKLGYSCAAIHPNCTVAESIGTTEIYDPATETFTEVGALTYPRLAHSLDLLDDGRAVVAGGAANNKGLQTVELFDPATKTWSKGPPLQGQRLYHASAVVEGALVVVGGKIANVSPISTTDVLDVGKDMWRSAASVPTPRTGAKLVALPTGHGLLVAGDNQITNEALKDARLYDVATDTWSSTSRRAAWIWYATASISRCASAFRMNRASSVACSGRGAPSMPRPRVSCGPWA
jgi:hypothetical protein